MRRVRRSPAGPSSARRQFLPCSRLRQRGPCREAGELCQLTADTNENIARAKRHWSYTAKPTRPMSATIDTDPDTHCRWQAAGRKTCSFFRFRAGPNSSASHSATTQPRTGDGSQSLQHRCRSSRDCARPQSCRRPLPIREAPRAYFEQNDPRPNPPFQSPDFKMPYAARWPRSRTTFLQIVIPL